MLDFLNTEIDDNEILIPLMFIVISLYCCDIAIAQWQFNFVMTIIKSL